MNKAALLFCLLSWMVAQSATADSSIQNSRAAFLAQLTAGVTEISPTSLQTALAEADSPVVLLDVRTYYERSRTQTIRGNQEIHIPRGFLEIKAWEQVPRDRHIVVYCSKGMRSKLAAATLQAMGWTRVSSLEGGIEAWYAMQGEDCGCLAEDQEIPAENSPFECTPGDARSR